MDGKISEPGVHGQPEQQSEDAEQDAEQQQIMAAHSQKIDLGEIGECQVGFAASVLGGLGNPLGALLGGLILGFLEGLIPTFMPVSWVPVLEFGLFVLVLLVRPTGILGGAD